MLCDQSARLRAFVRVVFACLAVLGASTEESAAELLVGAATADITPDQSVPLTGGTTMRESTGILSRCTANVLALESREGETVKDQAIFVSCDLCVIRPGIQDGFRKAVAARLPGFDIKKLFLAATHTHAAPVLLQDRYESYGKAMQPKDYVPFMYQLMADAVVKAWEEREPASVAWGLGHAVVGRNRRAVYENGSGVMYGDTAKPAFRRIEGYEDHSMQVLCFYNADKKLQAAVISLACPSQSVGGSQLSADFWHDARQLLRERHGEHLVVLGFTAAAGDQAPNLLWNKAAEARMNRLRGLTYTQELGRRIANGFDDVLGVIGQDTRSDVPFVHRVEEFGLPVRVVTDAEYAQAKAKCDALDAKEKMVGSDWWYRHFWGYVVVECAINLAA